MTMQKKVMTKKRSSDFWSGKVHARRENPGYAYDVKTWQVATHVVKEDNTLNNHCLS